MHNIRTILARKIREARALERAGYLFDEEGDDFTQGERHGSNGARLATLLDLVKEITPPRFNDHVRYYRHLKRNNMMQHYEN